MLRWTYFEEEVRFGAPSSMITAERRLPHCGSILDDYPRVDVSASPFARYMACMWHFIFFPLPPVEF